MAVDILTSDAAPAVGGGAAGVAMTGFWLFVTGKLFGDKERARLLLENDKRDATIAKIVEDKDKLIAEKDAYIKQLVSRLEDRNDSLIDNVVPALSTLVHDLITTKAGSKNGN